MKIVGLVALMLMLGGCMGNAAVIDAMARDQATICFSNSNMWSGTTNFARTNITNGDVECDKLKVKSSGQVTVTGSGATVQGPVVVK